MQYSGLRRKKTIFCQLAYTLPVLFLFPPLSAAVDDVTLQTLGDPQALEELERPGELFFSEGFEDGDFSDWFDAYGPPEIVDDPAKAHSGNCVLECVAAYNGDNSSTSSIKYWFHPGYDKAYYRWHVKFADDYDQGWGMHFCSMYAVQGDNRYNEMGGAGLKPDGDDNFGTGFEPWSEWESLVPPGRMQFYAYWHRMEPDIYDDNNDGIPDVHYWGNVFYPDPPAVPLRGRWYCMEIMTKANDAGQDNGEMAAWIDGELYQHLIGFNFRTTDDLKLKRVSLGIYIHNNPKANTAWFDDVALSTGYIGPDQPEKISDGLNRTRYRRTRHDGSAYLFDLRGNLVKVIPADNGNMAGSRIDKETRTLPQGVYLIRIQDRELIKIIKTFMIK